MAPKPMSPAKAWGITLTIIAAIGLVIALSANESAVAPASIAPRGDPATAAAVAAGASGAPQPIPIATREGRLAYARRVDSRLLDAGIESETYTWGPQSSTLVVKDALAGRVRAKIIYEALDFDYLRELGFKKIVYTDGFEDGDRFEWKVPQ